MSFSDISTRVAKKLSENAPTILTGLSAAGVITTAYLAGTASFKAAEIIRRDRETSTSDYEPTFKGDFRLVWQLYIPAIGVGSATIIGIVLANRIGTRRAAALAAAYSISEKAFSEYKEKVVETIGKNKEQKVRDEVAQDRVTQNPPSSGVVVVGGVGDTLFMDKWSGRYFTSDMESVKKAMNDTNYEILNQTYASLTDLYGRLGLQPTKESDNVGWNSDKLLEFQFSTTMSDDQRACIVIDFDVAPTRNFFRTR